MPVHREECRRPAAGTLTKFLESCWLRYHAESVCPTVAGLTDLQGRYRENDFDDFSHGDEWMLRAMHDMRNSDYDDDDDDDEMHGVHDDERRQQ